MSISLRNNLPPQNKQLENSSEMTPIKKTRKFQITRHERTSKRGPPKKRNAEVWRKAENWGWVFVEAGHQSDAILRNSARALNSVQNLKVMDLIHWRCDITDSGVLHLSDSLKRYSLSRSLRLIATECPKITDEGLYYAGKSLKRFSHLEILTLSFAGCPHITDQGALELSKGLKALAC